MLRNTTRHQTNMAKALFLHNYAPISLSKMKNVAKQNRTDTKYVLPVTTLQQVMSQLTDDYSTLVVNGQRLSEHRTLYFDTPEFDLYHRHHAGMLDRYKVRAREDVKSDLAFLEVQHKLNKGRTIKKRIKLSGWATDIDGKTPTRNGSIGLNNDKTAVFLQKNYPHNAANLEPKLWVEYSRITLVSQHHKERVTIDFNLRYTWEGNSIELPHIAIVEIKQEGVPHHSHIAQQLRQHQVRQTGFSKYGVGMSLIYPELKHNNFKPKLRLVEKLAQGQQVYIN